MCVDFARMNAYVCVSVLVCAHHLFRIIFEFNNKQQKKGRKTEGKKKKKIPRYKIESVCDAMRICAMNILVETMFTAEKIELNAHRHTHTTHTRHNLLPSSDFVIFFFLFSFSLSIRFGSSVQTQRIKYRRMYAMCIFCFW